VVAVEVRDENVSQPREVEMLEHHASLGAFATVNHQQLAVMLDNLASRQMARRGGCRAASKDV
jgi:hypothetical protein